MTKLSKYKLSPNVKVQYINDFYEAVFNLDSFDDLKNFSTHLFTLTEIETFAKRIAILKLLRGGLSYWEIKEQVKVTNATITKMVNILQKSDQQLLQTLDKLIEAEENRKRKKKQARYTKGSKQFFAKRG